MCVYVVYVYFRSIEQYNNIKSICGVEADSVDFDGNMGLKSRKVDTSWLNCFTLYESYVEFKQKAPVLQGPLKSFYVPSFPSVELSDTAVVSRLKFSRIRCKYVIDLYFSFTYSDSVLSVIIRFCGKIEIIYLFPPTPRFNVESQGSNEILLVLDRISVEQPLEILISNRLTIFTATSIYSSSLAWLSTFLNEFEKVGDSFLPNFTSKSNNIYKIGTYVDYGIKWPMILSLLEFEDSVMLFDLIGGKQVVKLLKLDSEVTVSHKLGVRPDLEPVVLTKVPLGISKVEFMEKYSEKFLLQVMQLQDKINHNNIWMNEAGKMQLELENELESVQKDLQESV